MICRRARSSASALRGRCWRKLRSLVLDEPTAALDGELEAHVQQALRAVARDRTVLMIAHRLLTIREADEIVVREAGRIEGRGSHAESLRGAGLYEKLWEHNGIAGGQLAD